MLNLESAFAKFRSRLELNDREKANASARQQEIREHMGRSFDVEHDFLTGSYARYTKTKPLKDVDIFCVLGGKDVRYREQAPGVLLESVRVSLAKKYGESCVTKQRRSVSINFGVTPDADDKTDYRVVSFDVVAAFALGPNYEIPDVGIRGSAGGWTKTNPRVHTDKAVAANKAYDGEWKGLVRMMKYWNNHHDKPIRPSFLIEVMALDLLHAPYCGDRARELQFFFASLAGRIHDTWQDPAGLGPPVSDALDDQQRAHAERCLLAAERAAAHAAALSRQGRQGDALRAWRSLMGPLFPLS